MSMNVTIQNGQTQLIDVDVIDLNVPRVVTRGSMHPGAVKVIAIRYSDSDSLGDIEVRYSTGWTQRFNNIYEGQIITL